MLLGRRARCRGRPRTVPAAGGRAGRGRSSRAPRPESPATAPGAAPRSPEPFPAYAATAVAPPTPGRRRSRATALPRGGARVGVAAGLAGAEHDHGHDGRPGHQREVGRPVVEPVQRTVAAACPRGRRRRRRCRAAPAARSGRRAGRGGTGRRGSARPGRRNRPVRPWNISSLVRAWTGRGRRIASSGPSMTPMWLAAKHHRPGGRDAVGAVDAARGSGCGPARARPVAPRGAAACGGWATSVLAGRSWWRSGVTPAPPPSRRGPPRGRSPRPG